jgi:hypothetical protein
VKLVDIVGKWDSAHKSLETVQAQFNLIRSNIENEFQQASVARDTFFSELQRRVQFFSDATATSISKALAEIEDAMKPLHSADPSAECGLFLFSALYVHFLTLFSDLMV